MVLLLSSVAPRSCICQINTNKRGYRALQVLLTPWTQEAHRQEGRPQHSLRPACTAQATVQTQVDVLLGCAESGYRRRARDHAATHRPTAGSQSLAALACMSVQVGRQINHCHNAPARSLFSARLFFSHHLKTLT